MSTATVPIVFAALASVSGWRVASAASALAPLAGTIVLRRAGG